MTFSFYQSLRTLPADLDEAAQSFGLTAWQRFWRLEVPFAMPGLIWNMMMSMSGAWFFVVASEAITVGDTDGHPARHRLLAGGGHRPPATLGAVAWAILAMAVVILLYDQLLFRPLVAWADKFRFEQTASADRAASPGCSTSCAAPGCCRACRPAARPRRAGQRLSAPSPPPPAPAHVRAARRARSTSSGLALVIGVVLWRLARWRVGYVARDADLARRRHGVRPGRLTPGCGSWC